MRTKAKGIQCESSGIRELKMKREKEERHEALQVVRYL